MSVVIKVENLSKYYRLGVIGGGTLREDLGRWWAMRRGRPDPLLKIGEEDHGNRKDGQIWALRDVNFEVREGEILGIIGRNGAGKSTLLKILSRITAPTAGKAKIKGRVASLLEVGTGFHPQLTGRENIFLNGTILGMSRREVGSKFEEIVEFAEMSQFIDTPVKRYSSGMTVRLAFAVAAYLEPEILIVDEVLAVGDAQFQRKCLGKMSDVAGEGRTIIFVSHNMAAIESLCQRGIVLRGGQLDFDGPSENAVMHYIDLTDRVIDGDLEHRSDRLGSGKLVFTGVEFLDKSKKTVSGFVSGKDYVIRLHYRVGAERLSGSKISIGIDDTRGKRVTILDSDLLGVELEFEPETDSWIEFKISRLALTEGIYRMTLYAGWSGEAADWIENAAEFTVIGGDFYGTGRTMPKANTGSFLMSHSIEKPS
ncbi:ABC transporter ATP-binding protein [Pseudomonadota bacterium]